MCVIRDVMRVRRVCVCDSIRWRAISRHICSLCHFYISVCSFYSVIWRIAECVCVLVEHFLCTHSSTSNHHSVLSICLLVPSCVLGRIAYSPFWLNGFAHINLHMTSKPAIDVPRQLCFSWCGPFGTKKMKRLNLRIAMLHSWASLLCTVYALNRANH